MARRELSDHSPLPSGERGGNTRGGRASGRLPFPSPPRGEGQGEGETPTSPGFLRLTPPPVIPDLSPEGRGGLLYAGPRYANLTVGLLGGSFNPAHDGHRHISLYALKALGLDRVWWLVSPQNPLKPAAGMAGLAERIAEAQQVAAHPRIEVTGIEQSLGTRYTVDTLHELTKRFPKTRFVWLMGADNLRQIPRWRGWQRIFRMVPVAVLARPAYSLNALNGKAAQRFARRRVDVHGVKGLARRRRPAWVFLRNPLHPASATAIRQARAAGS